jgi:dTDP-4-dehydrorhamnose reductase
MPPTAANNPIWVTGAAGLIGNCLVRSAPEAGRKVRGLSRGELELTDFKAVEKLFQAERPTAIIHCAALSRSPVCQANPKLAHQQNVEVTTFLAELAADIPFLFFSTDLVFDGQKGGYREEDAVNPLSVYAETKVAAERAVLRNGKHTVIRTSLNGGRSPTGDRGFNEEMRRAWGRGDALKFFIDEYRCPIAAKETAGATWALLQRGATGIHHVAGSERLSRFELGKLMAARCPELNPQYEAASLKAYQGAPRPPDCSLNCSKAQSLLSSRLPGMTEWLRSHPKEDF